MSTFFPPEWNPQSGVQLTWPHEDSDWSANLDEVNQCFAEIAREISKRQILLIVCKKRKGIEGLLSECTMDNIRFYELKSDDTWVRDHGGISVFNEGLPTILDFGFNGWGGKYPATLDNQITKRLFDHGAFRPEVNYQDHLDFILEGGSIETDGRGTLLTTSNCLLSKERNPNFSKEEIETYLKKNLGANRILWLNSGHLVGDDTDGHIDTLARFCNEETIAYVKCDDHSDPHFDSLQKMETVLKAFASWNGTPYRLIALPHADAVVENGQRLPATYANFLIINGAVLLPFYGSDKDEIARKTLQQVFSDRKVIGINCSSLIRQNGSLHCVTMQFPEGVLS